MTLIFDSEVYTVGEMRNRAFRRKISPDAILQMYAARGVTDPRFDLYDFQDDPTLVGAINTGTSGVPGNMAWTNAGLRSGDGWYVSPQIPGARGFGMVNNGGASGYVGSCGSHSGNTLSATDKFTIIAIVKVVSTGEAAQGRIFQKANNMDPGTLLYTFGTNQFEMDIGAGSATTINNAFIPNCWHIVIVSFDGSQVAGSRCHIYVDGFDKTAADLTDATITDDGNIMYFLDNFASTRAFNGIIGLFAICPEMAMTQLEAQNLVELRGGLQSTAGDQANILVPGMWGMPEYNFIRTEEDHFFAHQINPLMTSTGSLMVAFTSEDVANQQTLFGVSEDGNAVWHSLAIQVRGDIVNDPIELLGYNAGAANLRLSIPFGAGRLNVPSVVWFTSDGTTVRGYLDGREQVVSAVLGANTGQWWASYLSSTVFNIGAERHNTVEAEFDGREAKVLAYNRAVNYLEIQKHFASGGKWYPES